MQYKKLYEKERDAAHYSQSQLSSLQISLGACKEDNEKLKAAKQQLLNDLGRANSKRSSLDSAAFDVKCKLEDMAKEARLSDKHAVSLAMAHLADKLSAAMER
mgnify:CR=1 FL=1